MTYINEGGFLTPLNMGDLIVEMDVTLRLSIPPRVINSGPYSVDAVLFYSAFLLRHSKTITLFM